MERCCHSFDNNHLVTVREWWSWLQEQNNVDCWEETGNDKSDSLLTSPSFTSLRILRTLWLLKNVSQLPPLLTAGLSYNSIGFTGLRHMKANVLLWDFAKGRQPRGSPTYSLSSTLCMLHPIDAFSAVSVSWNVSVNRCCVRWTLLGSKVRSSQQALSGFMVCSSRWVRNIRTSAASHRHPVNIGTLEKTVKNLSN